MQFKNVVECIRYFEGNDLYDDNCVTREYHILNDAMLDGYLKRRSLLWPHRYIITDKGFAYLKENDDYDYSRMTNKQKRQLLKDTMFIKMATQLSRLGTCCRLKVGAILLREDGSIASGGYNGSLPGMDHCDNITCNSNQRCLHTSHAEENALFFSTGLIYTVYVTHEPCLACTRMLARRGVKRVIYGEEYTSIANNEKEERTKIIKHFDIVWEKFQKNYHTENA